MLRTIGLLGILYSGAITTLASAPLYVGVNLFDTTSLIGHAAGPFSLEFQLVGGPQADSGAANTAVLSAFQFFGGGPAGSPTYIGDVSGSLATSVKLTDTTFFNEFIQPFTPGAELRFRLALTSAFIDVPPDEFTFAILDRTGTEIPTRSPLDVFLQIDITSDNPPVQAFGTDPTRLPAGVGPGIAIATPNVLPVPEPKLWELIGGALIGMGWYRRYRAPA